MKKLIVVMFVWLASALPGQRVAIDIPAQNAADALLVLAEQTGWSVLFPTEELQAVESRAVIGTLSPLESAERMLAGSGYEAVRSGERRLVIARANERGRIGSRAAIDPGAAGEDPGEELSPLVRMSALIVTPSRFGVSNDPMMTSATLTHSDLETMPQLGEDLFRAVGVLPGMSTVDYSAAFWLRGAPNTQVLTLLDGVTLLEPYHMKDYDGALSIIDLDTVAGVDVYSGGFTAEFGDRLAGVFRMETDTHVREEMHTRLVASLTGLRATNRGVFAEGKGNWLVSGRLGYPDIAIEMAGGDSDGTIRYHDVFAKVAYRPVPAHELSLHVLHSNDTAELSELGRPDLESSYGNNYVWGRWQGTFGERLRGSAVLSYSRLEWERDAFGFFDDVREFALDETRDFSQLEFKQDWSYALADNLLLRAGSEYRDGEADYDYFRLRNDWALRDGAIVILPDVVDRAANPSGASHGGYTAVRWQPRDELTIEPGVRYDSADYGPGSGWAPRLTAAWDLSVGTIRASWGEYRQAQGLHELGVVDDDVTFYRAEKAEHRVIGFETTLPGDVNFRADIYQRITDNPRPHAESLSDANDIFSDGLADRIWLVPTEAEAKGVELVLSGDYSEHLKWSVSYAWARTHETLDEVEVPRTRDQEHTLLANLTWRPNAKWEASFSWQFHSGWPDTRKVFYPLTLDNGDVVVGREYGAYNADRLPAYHRLDLRVTRKWILRNSVLRAYVDVFNAYGNDNVEGYEDFGYIDSGVLQTGTSFDELFPIVPSVGIAWDF